MAKTEAEVLMEVYENVRTLSKMFIKPLKDIDVDNRLEINDTKFNSAYWIVAHLVWTEHFLLVKGVGGGDMNIQWLEEYCFGSNPDEIKSKPPYDEVLKTLDEVHLKAVHIVKKLQDHELEEENYINASFGGKKSKRVVIMHAIRHEPMHIGQLTWILKTNGLQYA